MSKRTIQQRLEAALRKRGEVKEESSNNRTARWSRRFKGERDADGGLVPNPPGGRPYWFVGLNGSLRIGKARTLSIAVKPVIKALLLKEGDAE